MTISTIGTIGFFCLGLAAHFVSGLIDSEALERLVPFCISGCILCLVLRVVGY